MPILNCFDPQKWPFCMVHLLLIALGSLPNPLPARGLCVLGRTVRTSWNFSHCTAELKELRFWGQMALGSNPGPTTPSIHKGVSEACPPPSLLRVSVALSLPSCCGGGAGRRPEGVRAELEEQGHQCIGSGFWGRRWAGQFGAVGGAQRWGRAWEMSC